VKLLKPSHSRLNHFALYWQKIVLPSTRAQLLPCERAKQCFALSVLKADAKITPTVVENLAKVSTLSLVFA